MTPRQRNFILTGIVFVILWIIGGSIEYFSGISAKEVLFDTIGGAAFISIIFARLFREAGRPQGPISLGNALREFRGLMLTKAKATTGLIILLADYVLVVHWLPSTGIEPMWTWVVDDLMWSIIALILAWGDLIYKCKKVGTSMKTAPVSSNVTR